MFAGLSIIDICDIDLDLTCHNSNRKLPLMLCYIYKLVQCKIGIQTKAISWYFVSNLSDNDFSLTQHVPYTILRRKISIQAMYIQDFIEIVQFEIKELIGNNIFAAARQYPACKTACPHGFPPTYCPDFKSLKYKYVNSM